MKHRLDKNSTMNFCPRPYKLYEPLRRYSLKFFNMKSLKTCYLECTAKSLGEAHHIGLQEIRFIPELILKRIDKL